MSLDELVTGSAAVLKSALAAASFENEPRFVWRRDNGRLQGRWEQRRTLQHIDFDTHAHRFDELIKRLHPALPELVGAGSLGQMRLDGPRLLTLLAHHVANASAEADLEATVLGALTELRRILHGEQPITIKFVCPTLNAVGTSGVHASFGDGTALREMTAEELADAYAGMYGFANWTEQVSEWAIVGELSATASIGSAGVPSFVDQETFQRRVHQACLAVRLARAAPADYQKTVLTEKAGLLSGGVTTLYARSSRERRVGTVTSADATEAQRLWGLLSGPRHPALDVAVERFSTGISRWEARDRIIDAVIGMEAILLATTGTPEYRGELSYRFAVNAAFLNGTPSERKAAFRKARHAYSLRSNLAHGGSLPTSVKLGHATFTLSEAADELARDLRDMIVQFLPAAMSPEFAAQDYWLDRYFG